MSRQKKNGTYVSFYIDREIMERIRLYADVHGQTLTKAVERLVEKALDNDEKKAAD